MHRRFVKLKHNEDLSNIRIDNLNHLVGISSGIIDSLLLLLEKNDREIINLRLEVCPNECEYITNCKKQCKTDSTAVESNDD